MFPGCLWVYSWVYDDDVGVESGTHRCGRGVPYEHRTRRKGWKKWQLWTGENSEEVREQICGRTHFKFLRSHVNAVLTTFPCL